MALKGFFPKSTFGANSLDIRSQNKVKVTEFMNNQMLMLEKIYGSTNDPRRKNHQEVLQQEYEEYTIEECLEMQMALKTAKPETPGLC